MNDPEEIPDPTGEPIPFEGAAFKLAKQVVKGTIYGVGICVASIFALVLAAPRTCAGAQSSAKLKWLERDQLIDQVMRNKTNQPPNQP